MRNDTQTSTKDQILDIAESHFATFGFAGTSLRGIIKEANVNVASVAYHFGSKDDLFAAVMKRFAAPVVEAQLTRLRSEISKPDLTLEKVLRAFYEPPIQLVHSMGAKGEKLSLFLGRCHSEPEPIFSLVDAHFASCRDEFIEAFRTLDSSQSEASYQWRFEFMLSLIVNFLTRHKSIMQRYQTETDWNALEVVDMLCQFCMHGMSAPLQAKSSKTEK
ncbi:MAG: TetR/AcrR family transcriptional regulator [Candidatus Obscuribacterales bacterium]|nr:TetR/AcrR family transcriptional regulator [Candidatus Obscuribacterales bacterium]